MTLTWLAEALRAEALTVIEHGNWLGRERPGSWQPSFGVIHATAAPRNQRDDVQVAVVRDGRSDLLGPIANACVDRAGRWHVLSGGRCNSTLVGTAGSFKGLGNTNALSTEACNDNGTEPWSAEQYDAYVRGWAAWCRRLGWPSAKLIGHREHTPGHKSDPTFSMSQFRADVARVIGSAKEPEMALKDEPLESNPNINCRRALDDVSTSLRLGHSGVGGTADRHWINRVLENIETKVSTPARVTLDPEQFAQLRDALAGQLGEIVEQRLRRVLGSLDGAASSGR